MIETLEDVFIEKYHATIGVKLINDGIKRGLKKGRNEVLNKMINAGILTPDQVVSLGYQINNGSKKIRSSRSRSE